MKLVVCSTLVYSISLYLFSATLSIFLSIGISFSQFEKRVKDRKNQDTMTLKQIYHSSILFEIAHYMSITRATYIQREREGEREIARKTRQTDHILIISIPFQLKLYVRFHSTNLLFRIQSSQTKSDKENLFVFFFYPFVIHTRCFR